MGKIKFISYRISHISYIISNVDSYGEISFFQRQQTYVFQNEKQGAKE